MCCRLCSSDNSRKCAAATNKSGHNFSGSSGAFFDQFSRSMVKMSQQMDVLTGNAGEIRLNCAVRNPGGPWVSSSGLLQHEGLEADA
jgi:peroxidase